MHPEGGWLIAALRALVDASVLSMLGAVLFRAVIGPAGLRSARWSAMVALTALPLWVAAEAADLVGSMTAAPELLTTTEFGRLAAASWLCALVALVVAGPGWRIAAALAASVGCVVLQAGHSHAAAMDPGLSTLRVSTTSHLLAAGAWLGGLMPLAAVVARAPLPEVVRAVDRYSILGIGCVLVLAITATVQASVLVGGLAGWVGTAYGRVATAKLVLFLALVGFAAINRRILTPALWARPQQTRRILARSIAAETVVGLAVVCAAALLSSTEPAMHQQPVWPFAVQPSLVSVNEEPDFLREVVLASAAIGFAGVILVAALMLRRFRLAALAVAALTVAVAWPHFGLLFIPATPTSFYTSPAAFAASSIMRGAALYPGHCARCHGSNGQGNGPDAASLPVPPADLTAEHLWMHPDGEVFWWLTHGMEAPEGGMAMPGFAAVLSEDERWALIDYIRAHNAGLVQAETGRWTPPLQAPELEAACPGGTTTTLADLRGHAIRLVFAGGPPPPLLPDAQAVTITVGPSGPDCIASDPAVPAAYAVVLGVQPADLAGSALLIDPNGWLRSAEAGRLDSAALAARVQQIRTNPLENTSGGNHHHAG